MSTGAVEAFLARVVETMGLQESRMLMLEAHVENLIRRVHVLEREHRWWYVACCSECVDAEIPFYSADECDEWCGQHAWSTGHQPTVDMKIRS